MRIFIASADRTFRWALHLLLESEPGIVVSSMSDRIDGLLANVESSQSEVLLLDYELAKQATIDLVGKVHQLEHRPQIIALSVDPQVKAAVLFAGADAFISKDAPPDELLPILRRMRRRLGET